MKAGFSPGSGTLKADVLQLGHQGVQWERRKSLNYRCEITTIVIVRIIIAFKGAIQDFLRSPHSATNHLQHVRCSGPGAIVCKSLAIHPALITCSTLCVTWYAGTAQLLSLTEFKLHLV